MALLVVIIYFSILWVILLIDPRISIL